MKTLIIGNLILINEGLSVLFIGKSMNLTVGNTFFTSLSITNVSPFFYLISWMFNSPSIVEVVVSSPLEEY